MARPIIAPSSCQHCGRKIEWFYDYDEDDPETPAGEEQTGWWVITGTDQNVCGGTEDGWHRPIGATDDNGWPETAGEENAR